MKNCVVKVSNLVKIFDKRKIINNVSFDVSENSVVGILGKNGAGKTTFASLVNRLHDPMSGNVLVDDKDLKQISIHALREAVAYVPQKPFLFDESIEENILLGQSAYTKGSIEGALRNANAWEFVQNMPHGIKQKIGEKGSRLSGGQLQRLALARAFYRNSPILLLDEATSALDTENEEKVHQAMHQLTKGKTTIMIAHRFSSIRMATRILVMDKGKIISDGSHQELYSSCQLYKSLYDNQLQTQ